MPSNLTDQTIKLTYRQLLHINGGVTATRKTVYDGGGVATALKVAVGSVSIDNISFDGNTVATLDTNGDLELTPHGTGRVVIGNARITGGVITALNSPIPVAAGGTGGSTPAAARAALGISEAGSAALAVSLNLSDLADKSVARTNLGVAIGSDVQAWGANLDLWALENPADYALGGDLSDYLTIVAAAAAYQPLTANLTTYSGITPSANVQSLLAAADYAAIKTLLSLSVGTDVQAYDAGLAALAVFNTNGILVQTANNTFAGRSLSAPAAGLTITNPAGTAGNPTFALANDLAALEGLSSTGFAVRSATDTWLQRSITGTANEITVTNGDGVSGAPAISIPAAITFTGKTVTGGTFSGITLSNNAIFANGSMPIWVGNGSVNRVTMDNSSTNWTVNRTNSSGTYIDSPLYMVLSTGVWNFNSAANLTAGGILTGVTLSGTVAGSPTFSGVPKFNGTATVSSGGTVKGYFGIGTQVDGGAGTDMVVRGEDGISFSISGSRYARLTTSALAVTASAITLGGVAIPTISSTDTLSNKTLSSPTVTGTIAGTATFSGVVGITGGSLSIGTSANPRFYLYNSAGTASTLVAGADSAAGWIGTFTAATMSFYANSILGMHMNTSGNLILQSTSVPLSIVSTNSNAYKLAWSDNGSARGYLGASSSYSLMVGTSGATTLTTWDNTSGLMTHNYAMTIVGDTTMTGNLQISKATPEIDLVGTSSNVPRIQFRNASRYDEIKNSTTGLQVGVNTSGTREDFYFTTTGFQGRTRAATTTTGTLVAADANTRTTLTGGITVPNAVFSAGDMHVWHAGTSARTITRGSGVTMYVNGTNVASATLAANCMGGAYWSDASTVHLTGAIS